jgi:hypothetical protein
MRDTDRDGRGHRPRRANSPCGFEAATSRARFGVALLCGVLLCLFVMPAAAQEVPREVMNEYRITAFPSYVISDKWAGFGYLGGVSKPEGDYTASYLGTGAYYRPADGIQLWVGLINVNTHYTTTKSNLLELRPFVGVKFMGSNARKWRYYNWTRFEVRFTDTLDTGDWQTVYRLRNQTRIEIPLASPERAWSPKSFYVLADIEPIYRSDSGQIDPLRLRAGLGYVVNPRLLVEFQYYFQYTRPGGGGLEHTDNIIRLNFKILSKKGLLAGLGGDFDD